MRGRSGGHGPLICCLRGDYRPMARPKDRRGLGSQSKTGWVTEEAPDRGRRFGRHRLMAVGLLCVSRRAAPAPKGRGSKSAWGMGADRRGASLISPRLAGKSCGTDKQNKQPSPDRRRKSFGYAWHPTDHHRMFFCRDQRRMTPITRAHTVRTAGVFDAGESKRRPQRNPFWLLTAIGGGFGFSRFCCRGDHSLVVIAPGVESCSANEPLGP